MRPYECVYILDPALTDDDMGALSERFQRIVVEQGGVVEGMDKWERRRLAYEVKGKREGIYYVLNFSADPGAEAELQRVLRLTEGVLRHIVVRLDELAVKHMQAQAALRRPATAPPQPAPAPEPAIAPPQPAETPEPESTEPPTTEAETHEATPEAVTASAQEETVES